VALSDKARPCATIPRSRGPTRRMTVLALLGAKAFWLLLVWLASAIVASYLSDRKGYGEKAGLVAASPSLRRHRHLADLAAKRDSRWKLQGPLGGATAEPSPAARGAGGGWGGDPIGRSHETGIRRRISPHPPPAPRAGWATVRPSPRPNAPAASSASALGRPDQPDGDGDEAEGEALTSPPSRHSPSCPTGRRPDGGGQPDEQQPECLRPRAAQGLSCAEVGLWTSGLSRRADALSDSATRRSPAQPLPLTRERSFAFCSTSRIVVPCSLISAIVS